jgi:hypothetical protein
VLLAQPLLLLAVDGRHFCHAVQRLGHLAPLGRQLAAVAAAGARERAARSHRGAHGLRRRASASQCGAVQRCRGAAVKGGFRGGVPQRKEARGWHPQGPASRGARKQGGAGAHTQLPRLTTRGRKTQSARSSRRRRPRGRCLL